MPRTAIYLAARLDRRLEMLDRAIELQRKGFLITSRWVWGAHDLRDESLSPTDRGRFAEEDLADIRAADILLSFSEPPGEWTSGGRHVELGFALALGRTCFLIGPRENIFHWHPHVIQFDEWSDALEHLHPVDL